jgi:hypothetical protein
MDANTGVGFTTTLITALGLQKPAGFVAVAVMVYTPAVVQFTLMVDTLVNEPEVKPVPGIITQLAAPFEL